MQCPVIMQYYVFYLFFFCIVFLLQKSRSQPTTTVLEPASAQVYVLCSLKVYPPQTEQQESKVWMLLYLRNVN